MKKQTLSPEAMRKQAEQLLRRADKAEDAANLTQRAALREKIAELNAKYTGTAWIYHETAPDSWRCVKIMGFSRDKDEPGAIEYTCQMLVLRRRDRDFNGMDVWGDPASVSRWSLRLEDADSPTALSRARMGKPFAPAKFDALLESLASFDAKMGAQLERLAKPLRKKPAKKLFPKVKKPR